MSSPITPPTPALADDDVRLRPWTPEDAPAIARIAADPEVPRWTYMPEGMTVEQAARWIAGFAAAAESGRALALAVEEAPSGAVIGTVGLGRIDDGRATAEVFWWLDVEARGRGLSTAAVGLLAGWAFDRLGLARLTAQVEPGNAASLALADRVGFRVEGLQRAAEPAKSGPGRIDLLLLALLSGDRAETGPAVDMEQRVSLITLGVVDLDRARRFYETLGWHGQQVESTVFFQAGGLVVALWSRGALAEDAGVADGVGFGGVALAHNVRSEAEVDAVVAAAERAGATVTRRPATTSWGGYAGCFTDPEGHVWEVAHNPGFPLTAGGAVVLPDLTG